MDWSKGFSSRYYATLVDRSNWRDIQRFEITGGAVKRSLGDLMHSATIETKAMDLGSEPLIRVWLEARQEDDSSRTPLFTGYATAPSRSINGNKITYSLECYSVLKPAADILLPRGWYAPVDVNVITQIKSLLKVTNSPVEILGETSDLTLNQAIVAEQNETNLSMAWVLLDAVNWRMLVDGKGIITLSEYPDDLSTVFDARENDIVELQITDSNDWYDVPNVIRVVMDDTYAEWRDENPNSKFSIQNRGREVWVEETSVTLNDKETLAEYARRRLSELQQVGRTVSYDRRFRPDIFPDDLVGFNYPKQDLVGSFMVTDQTITLGSGAKTSEEAIQL